jgi:hypothetical protein
MTVLSELLLLLGKLTHVTRTTPEFKLEQLYKLADTIKINKNAMTPKRSIQLKKLVSEQRSTVDESVSDFEIVYEEICRWGKEDELIVKDMEKELDNTPSPKQKRPKSESPERNIDRQHGKFRRITGNAADIQKCCACCGTETCAGTEEITKCSMLFKIAYEVSQRVTFDFKVLKAMNEQARRTAVEMAMQKGYMRSWEEERKNNFWAQYESYAQRPTGYQGRGDGRGGFPGRGGRDGGRGYYGGGYKPYAHASDAEAAPEVRVVEVTNA